MLSDAQQLERRATIVRILREGLVRRERSTVDRRVIHIRLSDKGQKLARQIQVEPMEIFRSALESLSAGEMRDLLRILTKIAQRVQGIVKREVRGPARKEP